MRNKFTQRQFEFFIDKMLLIHSEHDINSWKKLSKRLKSNNDLAKFLGTGKNDPFTNEMATFNKEVTRSIKSNMISNLEVLKRLLKYCNNLYIDDNYWKEYAKYKTENLSNEELDKLKAIEHILENNAEYSIFKEKFSNDFLKRLSFTLRRFQMRRLNESIKTLADEKNSKDIGFLSPYGDCFLAFAGYKDFTDFENDYNQSSKKSEKKVPKPIIQSGGKKISNLTKSVEQNALITKKDYSKYIGYYYDFPVKDIASFELGINFNQNAKVISKTGEEQYPAYQKDLHHNSKPSNGYAYVTSGIVHVVLWYVNEDLKKERIKIILRTGTNPDKNFFMNGNLLAIGTNRIPVSIGVLFTKKSKRPNEARILQIRRYLFLNRLNFIASKKHDSFRDITTRRVEVNHLNNICGTWLMWRFDNEWNIVTSLLRIRKDYRTFCYMVRKDSDTEKDSVQNQFCAIDVVKSGTDVVSFTGLKKTSVTRQFMIKYPSKHDEFTHGTFIFYAEQSKNLPKEPVMRVLALMKVTNRFDKYEDYFYFAENESSEDEESETRIAEQDENFDKRQSMEHKLIKEELRIYRSEENLTLAINGNHNFIKLMDLFERKNYENGVYPPGDRWKNYFKKP